MEYSYMRNYFCLLITLFTINGFAQNAIDSTLLKDKSNKAESTLNSAKESIKHTINVVTGIKKPSVPNKDSVILNSANPSDSIAKQSKDKIKNAVSIDEPKSKMENIESKKDSLSINNIQQNVKENAAVKNISDRFQSLPTNKDSVKKPSLPTANLSPSSYFDVKDKVNLNGKTSSVKGGIYSKKDALLAQKNKYNAQSLKPKAKTYAINQLKQIHPKGSIAAGYEYGILPSVIGGAVPTGGYRAEGQVGFDLLGLPLQATFHYTDIKNTVGMNNYFKISYDANQYKDKLAQKLNAKNLLTQNSLTNLQAQQQQLLQKLDYSNLLNQSLNFQNPLNTDFNLNNLTNGANLNGLTNGINTNYNLNSLVDTSGLMSKINGANLNQYTNINSSALQGYSIPQIQYLQKKDSIMKAIADNKAQYDSINKLVSETEQQLKEIKNLQNNAGKLTNPYLSKVQQFMSHVKKIEIGMCNPTYSMFLVNNIPLQGLNFEYEKNNNFFAITYGTTMNNLMFNTNTLQGAIQGARNLYNYFDFANLSSGRKILSVKGGVGAKEQTHLYVGFLVGKGKPDVNNSKNDSSNASIESNVVLELDAKYVFNQAASVDVIIGKSSVRDNDLSMNQISKAVNEIFSDYRSNAALVRFNYAIKKTNTKVTATTRWIDPYFKSFGVGFLRSDNLRYELKAEQPINKRIKYTVTYRREEDNLLNILAYKNILQSINNAVSIKLKKGVNIRLNYAPLFRELKTPEKIISDKNYMTTGIITWVPKFKKVNAQFNFLYSRYIITGDSANINFENYTYSQQFLFKSGITTSLSSTWFKDNLTDSLNNDTYLTVADIGYTSEKGYNISVGGKLALKNHMRPQYGFIAKVGVNLYKGLSLEAQAEKIVIGDYYSPEMTEQIKKFPFYFNSKFIYTF